MSEKASSRGWLYAVVAVAFFALGISGMLMLLHVGTPLDVKLLHIVMGIVFVAAGAIHLAMNWKTFTAHLRNRSATIAGTTAALIAIALLFVVGPEGPGPHGYGPRQEELGIGLGNDFDNGPDLIGDSSRGNGRGGRFGNGRWGGIRSESAGDIQWGAEVRSKK